MPSWTIENKFRLLLAIIGKNGNLKINYEEVAATMGPEFTVESVKNAFKRIKKEAGINAAAAAEGDGVVATPKKGTPRAPRTPSKRKGEEISNGNGEDDEELDSKNPKKAKKVKDEEED